MPARNMITPLLVVLAVLVAAVAAYAVGASSAAATSTEPNDRTEPLGVHVEGVGSASARPDVLHVTIGVEAPAPTVDAALEQANAAAAAVLEALRASGVEESDVQTQNLGLDPQFAPETRDVTGYVARQDLAVTLRDIAAAGATISAAVAAGGDAARLSGLQFAIEDDTAVRAEAREEAFAAARRQAEQYAELAGRELGEVLSVREQTRPEGPVPAAAGLARAEAVPLAPGSNDVTVTTQVRWALR